MTANVNVTKLLFKRGNTVQNANYTGINGEITVDTQAKTLRIHDGVTAGGNVITAGGVVGSYSNTNAAAYIPVDPTITSLQANVAAANAAISAITGIDTSLIANAATQQTQINLLNANIAAANALIPNLLAVSGNILPSANVTYSLGSSTRQWKDLWVSNNTIYIGNTPIRVDGGNLLINNSPIVSGPASSLVNGAATFQLFANGESRSPDTIFAANGVSIINANGAVQGGIYNSGDADWFNIGAGAGRGFKFYVNTEDPGPLFFANGSVNVPGNLYSAAGVIGDVSLYGGTISGTNPSWNYLTLTNQVEGSVFVQLPSEATANVANLRIHNDIGNIEIATGDGFSYNYWYFGNDGDLTIPRNIFGTGTNPLVIQNTSTGSAYLELPIAPGTNPVYLSNQDPAGNVVVRTGDFGSENDWTFGMDGNLTIPGNITMGPGSGRLLSVVTPEPGLVSWEFGMDGNLTIPGNINYSNGISILSGIGGAVNGNIVVGDSQIQFVANSSGDGYGLSTIRLVPYTPGYDSAIIIIDPTYPNHIHMRAGFEQDNAAANLFLGGEASHFNVEEGANPNVSIRSNYYTWKFGTDGRLQLPEIGESSSEIFTGSGGISIKSPQYTELRYSSTDPGNVSPTLNTEGYIWITNDGAHIQNYHGGQFNLEWLFGTDGNLTIPGNINYGNGVSILDGVGGAVTFGNTIAIGYSTGTVSQGSEAVAVGRLAGNVNQSAAAVAVGRAAGRDNQGIEAVSIGADTGQQNQGNYAIAIGSVTAYLNQGTGAVAIGTSAGSVNQGTNAIAIGTGAGTGNQGNNSIILNATGSALEQTTDNTFTVKPIRNASSSNVLYYDSTTGEITYDTAGAGSYGNTEVAAYLPTYSGNVGAARVQVTNAVDFMYGGFPYMGWQLSGSDTLKLRTNIASGDYTNDAVIVDRQSLAVNVVATLSAGNIITTSGVFWSNGTAYSTGGGTYGNTEVAAYLTTYTGNIAAGNVNVTSTVNAANIVTSGTSGNISGVNVISANTFVFAANGVNILSVAGGTYGNTEVAAYLLTWPNIDSNILDATSANITTLRANNFSTANAVISGGYISALTNASIISGTITTLNSTGGNITTLRATNFGTANAVITGGYINSLANLTATTAVLTNLSTGNAVISGGYISALTNAYITTSAITNFSTANAVITGGYASGLANVTATGNVTAGNLIGYGSNTSIIAGAYTSTFDNVGNVILPNVFVSGNTTAMGIAAGYAPNRPAFRVYGNGAVPIWHNTANVNLKGSAIAVDHNQGNYFNSTNGKFTAPVSGLYMTTLQARVGDNNGLNQIAVLKNGNNSGANVVCFWETDTNTGTATHFGTSGVVLLSPGDFLSANILAGNINFDGNDSWTVTYLG